MAYKIVITSFAKNQLEKYISYTLSEFKNVQAARAIKCDAKETVKKLSNIADKLALCENEILSQNGYRKIKFAKHDFFMVYKIDKNTVIVNAMYHELQDYESIFTKQMHLNN